MVSTSSTTSRARARAVRFAWMPRRSAPTAFRGSVPVAVRGVTTTGAAASRSRCGGRARGRPRPGPAPGREVERGPAGTLGRPLLAEPGERGGAGVAGGVVEVLLDPQQLVVLGHP